MAKVTIGGKEYDIPPLNLKAVKKIWPHLEKVQTGEDYLANIDALVAMVSIGLSKTDTPLTPDEIEDAMLAAEMAPLRTTIDDILIEAGLVKPGEPMAAPETVPVPTSPESLLTEIQTP